MEWGTVTGLVDFQQRNFHHRFRRELDGFLGCERNRRNDFGGGWDGDADWKPELHEFLEFHLFQRRDHRGGKIRYDA